MVSGTTLAFVSFINLFFVPVVALKIYCSRHEMRWIITPRLVYLYILMVVLNLPLTYVLVNAIEAITSLTIYVETVKYTVVALLSSVILPFIMEIVEKYVHVDVTISKQDPRKKEKRGRKSAKEED